jgi:hypothetical protein
MTRTIRLADLTPREQQSALLVLSGYAKRLRAILEESAQRNGYVRRQLEALSEEYGPRLGFLERAYVREVLPKREAERAAARNDARFWNGDGRLK